mmetsp:Transcript_12636/g.50763  ORF Transcript_12636/g.50763 Transcript_12636/m.50763 type:complete len:220 (+) Transcript_12636:611-1270(+)
MPATPRRARRRSSRATRTSRSRSARRRPTATSWRRAPRASPRARAARSASGIGAKQLRRRVVSIRCCSSRRLGTPRTSPGASFWDTTSRLPRPPPCSRRAPRTARSRSGTSIAAPRSCLRRGSWRYPTPPPSSPTSASSTRRTLRRRTPRSQAAGPSSWRRPHSRAVSTASTTASRWPPSCHRTTRTRLSERRGGHHHHAHSVNGRPAAAECRALYSQQ